MIKSRIILCLLLFAVLSPIVTLGYALPVRHSATFQSPESQGVQVWFDSVQLTVLYPPTYMFNVHAQTSAGLWIKSLHWDFGDGAILDLPFCCQSQISDVRAHAYANQGNYVITVTACDSAGNCNSVCQSLRPDFTLAASPMSETTMQGGSTAFNVNVGSVCGSNVQVALTISSPPPSGVTWSFNPNLGTTSFTSVLAVQTTVGTPTGTYMLTIVASGANTTHSASVMVTVTTPPPHPPDIVLTLAPQTFGLSLCNSAGSTTLTVQSINFNSPVTLTANPTNGITVTFSPSVVAPTLNGTATSQVAVIPSSATGPGTYTIQINAASTSPPIQRSTPLTVNLTACIPGFSVESMIVGIALGILALAFVRRTRSKRTQ